MSCMGGLWRDGDPAGTLYGKQISGFQGEEGIGRRERHICIRSQKLIKFYTLNKDDFLPVSNTAIMLFKESTVFKDSGLVATL